MNEAAEVNLLTGVTIPLTVLRMIQIATKTRNREFVFLKQ